MTDIILMRRRESVGLHKVWPQHILLLGRDSNIKYNELQTSNGEKTILAVNSFSTLDDRDLSIASSPPELTDLTTWEDRDGVRYLPFSLLLCEYSPLGLKKGGGQTFSIDIDKKFYLLCCDIHSLQ